MERFPTKKKKNLTSLMEIFCLLCWVILYSRLMLIFSLRLLTK